VDLGYGECSAITKPRSAEPTLDLLQRSGLERVCATKFAGADHAASDFLPLLMQFYTHRLAESLQTA
jgi:hypothetical protein